MGRVWGLYAAVMWQPGVVRGGGMGVGVVFGCDVAAGGRQRQWEGCGGPYAAVTWQPGVVRGGGMRVGGDSGDVGERNIPPRGEGQTGAGDVACAKRWAGVGVRDERALAWPKWAFARGSSSRGGGGMWWLEGRK